MSRQLDELLESISNRTEKAHALLLPVSGGSDSALLFKLFNMVCPQKISGIYIGNSLRHEEWFDNVGHVEIMDLAFNPNEAEVMRWATFLNSALQKNAWLVGSRNKTEDILGTYSLASRVATYLPLVDTLKIQVLSLCKELDIPDAIIDSSRVADPDCGRPEQMAAISIEKIDDYIMSHGDLLSEEEKQYLNKVISSNSFKASLPYRG